MKIVVTSDWHGDAVTAGLVRYDDVADAVAQSERVAIANHAALYVFAGDLADPDDPRSHRAVAMAARTIWRLSLENIPSLWITGNHDVVEDGSGSSTLEPLRFVSPDFGVIASRPALHHFSALDVVALPFVEQAADYDPVEQIMALTVGRFPERPLVLVSHLNLEGIASGSETTDMARGRSVFLPLELVSRFSLAINGHYHRRQMYRGVHVPGSLVRLRRDEHDNAPAISLIEVSA